MIINYRVYLKRSATTRFKDTGIIESNKAAAETFWADLVRRFNYVDFKLFPITYGVAIKR